MTNKINEIITKWNNENMSYYQILNICKAGSKHKKACVRDLNGFNKIMEQRHKTLADGKTALFEGLTAYDIDLLLKWNKILNGQ